MLKYECTGNLETLVKHAGLKSVCSFYLFVTTEVAHTLTCNAVSIFLYRYGYQFSSQFF